jgi:ATP-dependent DNA helicase RecG
MHRSYEITSYIKFYQYSDRIEIENPGGLYGNARPENFPNVSDYRNLVISESMRVMGFVNRFNRGIADAQLALKNNKNEPAEFDLNTFGVFGVKIKEKPIEKIKASFSNPWDGDTIKETGSETDSSSVTINYPLNYPLNDAIKNDLAKILDLIQKQSGITQTNIIKEIKKSRRTIFGYLNILRNNELIEYRGSKKTGGYYLTEKAQNKLKS